MQPCALARLFLGALTAMTLLPLCQGVAPPPSDPLEDGLPAGALRRLGSLRLRGSASTMEWSPDGSKIVTAGWRTRFWEASTGRLLPLRLEQTDATGSKPASLQVTETLGAWLAPSGKAIYTLEERQRPYRLFLSRFDLGSGRRIARDIEDRVATGVAVSPVGDLIAVAMAENSLQILDASTLKTLRTVQFEKRFYHARLTCFSHRGDLLAFFDGEKRSGDIYLYSVKDGSRAGTLTGHRRMAYALAFSPTADILVSCDENRTIVWDVNKKAAMRDLGVPGMSLAFSRDGKRLALSRSDRGEVRIYDTAGWKVVRTLDRCGLYARLALSSDGKRLVTGGATSASLRIWDVETGKELLDRPGHREGVKYIRFSPDGRSLYSFDGGDRILRWDVATGKEIGPLSLFADDGSGVVPLRSLVISDDGKQLAAVDGLAHSVKQSKSFFVWDRADDPRSRRELLNGEPAWMLALSPDERTVAVISSGTPGGVRLWDRDSGRSTRFLTDPSPKPREGRLAKVVPPVTGGKAVAFSPDGRTLAAGEPGQILLWDWRAATLLHRLPASPMTAVHHVTFSPGGHLIAGCAASNPGARPPSLPSVLLWETSSGKPFAVLRTDGGPFLASAFSPDGRLLAVAENGGTVRVWDVFAREPLAAFASHATCVEFSPDGRTLASGSADTTILLWDVSKLRPSLPVSASSPKGLAEWWDELASDDYELARRAMLGLAGGGDDAAGFLSKRLEPVPKFAPGRLDGLIKQLDDDSRIKRDAASAELEKLGLLAEPALRRALAGRPPAETKKRARNILQKAEGLRNTPDALRSSRALLALELMRSTAATECLARLAEGEPDAERTRAAKSALLRVRKFPRESP